MKRPEIVCGTQKVQPYFRNWGCPFFLSLQTSNYSSRRCRGEEWGRGAHPQQTRGSGLHCKHPQRGRAQSPSRKRFGGISCAILCNFTHILVHLTAASKWEIPTSLCWLVGLKFPFNRTPQLEFLGCPNTHDTQWREWYTLSPFLSPRCLLPL